MNESESEFNFSSEGSQENNQTEESKFLNLRELRKEILRISTWYLWIMQEKREVYS